MGNPQWMKRTLQRERRPGEAVLEIAAGDGKLAAYLHRHANGSTPEIYDGLDLWPKPDGWHGNWHREDLLKFQDFALYPVIMANLILHQFEDEALARLGSRWQQARLIIASEPQRSRFHHRLTGLLPLIGANRVTAHDARVSVMAGFRDGELGLLLGLSPKTWDISETRNWRGALRFVARRR